MSTTEPRAATPPPRSPSVADVYRDRYVSLVHLATFLTGSRATAEEIVQEAFLNTILRERNIASDAVTAYVYRAVVNGSRRAVRRGMGHQRALRLLPPISTEPSAAEAVITAEQHNALLASVRLLPKRQREVLTLRYLSELSVAETALALRIGRNAVAAATTHGLRALRIIWESQ